MAIEVIQAFARIGILATVTALSGCGSVTEKTAPCKRPTALSFFAQDLRQECGPMRAVNDPTAAFAAVGLN